MSPTNDGRPLYIASLPFLPVKPVFTRPKLKEISKLSELDQSNRLWKQMLDHSDSPEMFTYGN